MRVFFLFFLSFALLFVSGCSTGPLGSKKNPIKMYFVPSMEASRVIMGAEGIAKYLEDKTGYHYKVAVPTSYAAVIEAIGTDECDAAFLATFAYVLAHQKYDAQVALTTIRNGLKEYRGQFVTRTDTGIDSLPQIQGRSIAYTDASSTAGYVFPYAMLKQKGIEPKRIIMAGGHPQAIMAMYQGTADVACTFWSPPDSSGMIQDARKNLLATYPDMLQKTKIIGFTDWIPNDTVTFRKGMPKKMQEKIVNALLDFVKTPEGQKTMKELYQVTGFYKSDDHVYDKVRETLKIMGVDPEKLVK